MYNSQNISFQSGIPLRLNPSTPSPLWGEVGCLNFKLSTLNLKPAKQVRCRCPDSALLFRVIRVIRGQQSLTHSDTPRHGSRRMQMHPNALKCTVRGNRPPVEHSRLLACIRGKNLCSHVKNPIRNPTPPCATQIRLDPTPNFGRASAPASPLNSLSASNGDHGSRSDRPRVGA